MKKGKLTVDSSKLKEKNKSKDNAETLRAQRNAEKLS